jgi:hypothetical protein
LNSKEIVPLSSVITPWKNPKRINGLHIADEKIHILNRNIILKDEILDRTFTKVAGKFISLSDTSFKNVCPFAVIRELNIT